jgi:hypothetical protein
MPLSSSQKTLGHVAGLLGTLQGFAWFLMSLLCLIFYYQGLHVDPSSISFATAVYLRFLDKNGFSSSEMIVIPEGFSAFNWVYVVTALSWALLSLFLCYDIKKDAPKLYKSIKWFVFATYFIAILDFILVVAMGIDYDKGCTGNVSPRTHEICKNGVLPVLVIVGRGGVVWVLNLVLAYRLNKIGRMAKLEWEATEREQLESQSIDVSGICAMSAIDASEDAISVFSQSSLNMPRYEYRYEYQYAYRPTTEYRINPITGMSETYSTMSCSLGLDYVLKERY